MQIVLTAERLRSILDYNPATGTFVWKVRSNGRVPAGTKAGVLHHTGYSLIKVDKRRYPAHRLAWLWVKGEWPSAQVDHRNRKRHDNRWKNLREATQPQNSRNAKTRIHSSKFKGVSFHRATGKWQASVGADYKQYYLGLFDTPELAAAARNKKAKELHGEFAS